MSLDKELMDVAQAYLSMHEKTKTEDASNDKSDDGDGMDKVDPKAVKKKFKDRKDKDIDNDGDEDDSDEYLHKRRQAISKNEGKRGFILAAKKAKDAGEKEFVFAGKKYNCEDALKTEAVEIEVDDKSDASPEMDKKDDLKKKKKKDPKVSKAKDDDEDEATATEQKEGVDTSPAGDSPPAKRASVRDKGVLDMLRSKTAEKRRDEDKQDGTNAVKAAPTRPGDSKVGEKQMKKFKEMR
jgi:hypothetical protein